MSETCVSSFLDAPEWNFSCRASKKWSDHLFSHSSHPHVAGTFDDSFMPSSPPPPAPPSAWLHSAAAAESRLMALGLPVSGNSSGKGDHEQGGRGDENEDGGDEVEEAVGQDEDVPTPKRVDMVKFEVRIISSYQWFKLPLIPHIVACFFMLCTKFSGSILHVAMLFRATDAGCNHMDGRQHVRVLHVLLVVLHTAQSVH
jgi:hypothetical protein